MTHLKGFLRVVPGFDFSCLARYSFQLEQSRLSCAGLLSGTVSLSTLNTHSQMVQAMFSISNHIYLQTTYKNSLEGLRR